MKKHVFIINPTSGVGRYKDVLSWIEEYFYDSTVPYEIHQTQYEKHATEIAREYRGDVILYSVGGDGTAHEILNGIHPEVEMAVIPVGTGNDFWRMVNFRGDLREVLFETIEGKVCEIDIGLANGHRFLNCANIGIDAEVNKFVNNIRHPLFPRNIIYLYAALRELLRYKPTEIEVEIDGQKKDYKIVLSSFMNGKWYGGGFMSAPKAKLNDKKLDMCLVEDMPRLRMIPIILKYYKGEHLNLPEVTYVQVSEVKLKSPHKIPLGCDGEIFEFEEISLGLDSDVLKFRIPKSASI